MGNLKEFIQIAPYLSNPLILIGFILFIFFSFYRLLIKSKTIPPLSESHGSQILKLLLKYGFVISIFVIVLGFTQAVYKMHLSSKPDVERIQVIEKEKEEPDLYITLAPKDETIWSHEEIDNSIKYPLESTTFQAIAPSTFKECTFSEEENITVMMKVTAIPYILNFGDIDAKDLWFTMYFDPHIKVWATGTDAWNVGRDLNRDKIVVKFDGTRSIFNSDISKQSINGTFGALALNFPPIPRTYEINYVIGHSSSKFKERKLEFIVKTDFVPFEFIENARGLEAMERKELIQALEHFKVAASTNTEFGAFPFNVGTVLMQLNKPSEAEHYFKMASQLSSERYEIWGNWAWCLLEQGKYSSAIVYIKKALSINPNSKGDKHNLLLAHTNFGTDLFEKGKYAEAIEQFKILTELDPRNTEAFYNWGFILYNQGDNDGAIVKYKKAIALDPSFMNS
jgi:Tfp pilus assembly protein PilF